MRAAFLVFSLFSLLKHISSMRFLLSCFGQGMPYRILALESENESHADEVEDDTSAYVCENQDDDLPFLDNIVPEFFSMHVDDDGYQYLIRIPASHYQFAYYVNFRDRVCVA